MKKLLKTLLITAAITISTGALAETIGEHVDNAVDSVKSGANTTKIVISDQNLERKINNVLAAQLPNGSFTVTSYHANVLLAGQVSNTEDKNKAERAVKETDGVKAVWSYLTVEANETAADISKDALITTKVKNKLLMQKGINSANIKVVTSHGVVYLLGGSVGKTHKVNKAIKNISKIEGVLNVVNLIGKNLNNLK